MEPNFVKQGPVEPKVALANPDLKVQDIDTRFQSYMKGPFFMNKSMSFLIFPGKSGQLIKPHSFSRNLLD